MGITITSVLTSCILNSLLILVLCIVFRRNSVMYRIGPGCMIVLYVAVILRMFVPLEFPYTYSVRIEDVLTPARRALEQPVAPQAEGFTVWDLMMLVWGVGIVGIVAYKTVVYRRVNRCLSCLSGKTWGEVRDRCRVSIGPVPRMERLKVVYSEQCSSPVLIGHLNPILVLPPVEYEEEQYQYILMHELMHLKNRDIVWKVLIELLCTGFWWNPVFWLLKKELFQLIEMRNDMQMVTRLSGRERIGYMECLKNTAVQLGQRDAFYGVGFSRSDYQSLKRRMELIAGYRKFSRRRQAAAGLWVCALLAVSTMVIFEPYSYDHGEGEAVTEDNTYLVENGESYDVYYDGKYAFTTEDLTPFPGVKIYKTNEEAEAND